MILRSVTLTVVGTIGVLLMLLAGATGTFLADREPPITVERVEVQQETVPPGGLLRITFTVNRLRPCETHVDRVLLDSSNSRVVLPDYDFFAPPGPLGVERYTTTIDVPRDFVPGPARYISTSQFVCNVIHRWFWPITTSPRETRFYVAPRPEPS